MTLKEYLRKQVEKDFDKFLTENDILFCRQLAESVRIENQKKAEQDGKKKPFLRGRWHEGKLLTMNTAIVILSVSEEPVLKIPRFVPKARSGGLHLRII